MLPKSDSHQHSVSVQDFEDKIFSSRTHTETGILPICWISTIFPIRWPNDNTISMMSVILTWQGRGYSISTGLMIDSNRVVAEIPELQPKILPIEPETYREIGLSRKKKMKPAGG